VLEHILLTEQHQTIDEDQKIFEIKRERYRGEIWRYEMGK